MERKDKHILEVLRDLYFQYGLGKSYWEVDVLNVPVQNSPQVE